MVGRFNESQNRKDEYQLQVPDSLVRWKRFDTGVDDKSFVDSILKDVSKSKRNKDKGIEYKTAKDICIEYDISMSQLVKIIEAEKAAKNLEGGKFILSGNTKVLEDGSVGRAYSRAGELMVKCIEDAYKMLDFKVPITGEYLLASPSEGWAGAH